MAPFKRVRKSSLPCKWVRLRAIFIMVCSCCKCGIANLLTPVSRAIYKASRLASSPLKRDQSRSYPHSWASCFVNVRKVRLLPFFHPVGSPRCWPVLARHHILASDKRQVLKNSPMNFTEVFAIKIAPNGVNFQLDDAPKRVTGFKRIARTGRQCLILIGRINDRHARSPQGQWSRQ